MIHYNITYDGKEPTPQKLTVPINQRFCINIKMKNVQTNNWYNMMPCIYVDGVQKRGADVILDQKEETMEQTYIMKPHGECGRVEYVFEGYGSAKKYCPQFNLSIDFIDGPLLDDIQYAQRSFYSENTNPTVRQKMDWEVDSISFADKPKQFLNVMDTRNQTFLINGQLQKETIKKIGSQEISVWSYEPNIAFNAMLKMEKGCTFMGQKVIAKDVTVGGETFTVLALEPQS